MDLFCCRENSDDASGNMDSSLHVYIYIYIYICIIYIYICISYVYIHLLIQYILIYTQDIRCFFFIVIHRPYHVFKATMIDFTALQWTNLHRCVQEISILLLVTHVRTCSQTDIGFMSID